MECMCPPAGSGSEQAKPALHSPQTALLLGSQQKALSTLRSSPSRKHPHRPTQSSWLKPDSCPAHTASNPLVPALSPEQAEDQSSFVSSLSVTLVFLPVTLYTGATTNCFLLTPHPALLFCALFCPCYLMLKCSSFQHLIGCHSQETS